VIEEEIFALTERVSICVVRILLDTGSVRATVPMLRGVWGRALRDLDPVIYKSVFEGYRTNETPSDGRMNVPLYILRPAPPEPNYAPAVELLLLGNACAHFPVALEAFELAGKAGLGPRREPFRIRKMCGILPDGRQIDEPLTWSASSAASCHLRGMSKNAGLRLEFGAPLRLLRRRKLISDPSFSDIAISGLRRLCAFSSISVRRDLAQRVPDAARRLPVSDWYGRRQDFVRWSAHKGTGLKCAG